MKVLDPSIIAKVFTDEVKFEIEKENYTINIIGFLASDDLASNTYAEYTKKACESVGINFSLKKVDKSSIQDLILEANLDSTVHGIFVYYPIYGTKQDNTIKDLVSPKKDVEGLTTYWATKLYNNERFHSVGTQSFKSILPCTPLAILKILEKTDLYSEYGLPFQDKTITIFNRSEIVGKPLAYMLGNDGAKVFSFDIDGVLEITNTEAKETNISRQEALKQSEIVITGVPNKNFEKISKHEVKQNIVALNFSTIQNFTKEAIEYVDIYIPRVGPLTIAMCIKNSLRLYKNYHSNEY